MIATAKVTAVKEVTNVALIQLDDREALLRCSDDGQPRYVFIDALRGIAAMAVVFHHLLYSPLFDALHRTVPKVIMTGCEHGFLGVQVFFVISGFVIAHSLRSTILAANSLGLFAVRRQLRLDPPYWTVLFGSIALWAVQLVIFGSDRMDPLPSFASVLLNLVYLQKVFGAAEVVGVAWTLCIEIQFYLFFALLMWVGQRGRPSGQPSRLAVALIVATGALSSLLDPNTPKQTWLAPYWCFFAAGVLSYWSIRRVVGHWVFLVFVGGLLTSSLRHHWNAPIYAGVLAAVTVYAAGVTGRLTTLLGGPIFQYLGRISYSLYLVHWPVKVVVLSIGFQLTRQNGAAAVGWCILMIMTSIATAHLLYVLVERPSMRWASSLKRSSWGHTAMPPKSRRCQ
jgi:peptidoglycan/LPS O-acetylase OafA/YrhL